MEITLLFLIIGLFAAMLFLNIYFRIKVLKHYRVLVRNKVEFTSRHVFNEEMMRNEILVRHPDLEEDLFSFSRNLRYSIKMATVLIVLITLFGAVLMYFR